MSIIIINNKAPTITHIVISRIVRGLLVEPLQWEGTDDHFEELTAGHTTVLEGVGVELG